MQTTTISAIDAGVQKTHEFLSRLTEIGNFEDDAQSYSAFRAVIHSLRDRLTVEEAAHLASHFPDPIRGIYYEGWKPSKAPNAERTLDEFIASVKESLPGNTNFDIPHAIESVCALLDEFVDPGEVRHVREMLPTPIREQFWSRE